MLKNLLENIATFMSFFLSGHIINQCFEEVSAVGQTHIKKGTSFPL